jgi:hypothetical protein
MLSLLLQLLRRARIHARRWRWRRHRRRRPHHVDVHGDRTATTSEPPPAPLQKVARGGRDEARGQQVERPKKNEGRPSRPSAHDLCCRSGFVGWSGLVSVALPAISPFKCLCRLGKGAVVRDRGRRARGQGAIFAGRALHLLGVRWAGWAERKIDFKRSGQEGGKKTRSTSAFSYPQSVLAGEVDGRTEHKPPIPTERGRRGRRRATPDEVRGPPEGEEAGRLSTISHLASHT